MSLQPGPLLCTSKDTFHCFLPLVKTREFSKIEHQPIKQSTTITQDFSDELAIWRKTSSWINPITNPAMSNACSPSSASPYPPPTLHPRTRLADTQTTLAPESIPKPKGSSARPARGGYNLQEALNLPEETYKELQVKLKDHKEISTTEKTFSQESVRVLAGDYMDMGKPYQQQKASAITKFAEAVSSMSTSYILFSFAQRALF
jgi:hypothetical protein